MPIAAQILTPKTADASVAINDVSQTAPLARIVGLTTATPALEQSQQLIGEEFATLWRLRGARLERWRRIIRGSQIQTRHAVVPIGEIAHLSTAQRMRLYERHAPALAEQAARTALRRAGLSASAVTDVIVVSCTGFSAPGVDVELILRLGMESDVRRSVIGFMGCFGAITGLRAALGVCAMDRAAVTLLVCVELCSLHLRSENDVPNQIASALFADGAGAVVVCGSDCQRPAPGSASTGRSLGLRIANAGASRLLADRREDMSWRITDAGFAMTLSPRVPKALEKHLGSFVQSARPAPRTLAVHPGGASILDAAQRSVDPNLAYGVDAARDVMRDHGNMSSPSVLFVLEKLLNQGAPAPIMLTAFGPGLTIDSITVVSDD